jgi:hypothetical protein
MQRADISSIILIWNSFLKKTMDVAAPQLHNFLGLLG